MAIDALSKAKVLCEKYEEQIYHNIHLEYEPGCLYYYFCDEVTQLLHLIMISDRGDFPQDVKIINRIFDRNYSYSELQKIYGFDASSENSFLLKYLPVLEHMAVAEKMNHQGFQCEMPDCHSLLSIIQEIGNEFLKSTSHSDMQIGIFSDYMKRQKTCVFAMEMIDDFDLDHYIFTTERPTNSQTQYDVIVKKKKEEDKILLKSETGVLIAEEDWKEAAATQMLSHVALHNFTGDTAEEKIKSKKKVSGVFIFLSFFTLIILSLALYTKHYMDQEFMQHEFSNIVHVNFSMEEPQVIDYENTLKATSDYGDVNNFTLEYRRPNDIHTYQFYENNQKLMAIYYDTSASKMSLEDYIAKIGEYDEISEDGSYVWYGNIHGQYCTMTITVNENLVNPKKSQVHMKINKVVTSKEFFQSFKRIGSH